MTNVAPSKDDLERQKLALEIRELQRKWWQRPVYLSVLLPMVLAALTVLAGYLSGYFNQERRQLTRDIEALKTEKNALAQNLNNLAAENKAAREQLHTKTELMNKIGAETSKLVKAFEEQGYRLEELKPSPSPN